MLYDFPPFFKCASDFFLFFLSLFIFDLLHALLSIKISNDTILHTFMYTPNDNIYYIFAEKKTDLHNFMIFHGILWFSHFSFPFFSFYFFIIIFTDILNYNNIMFPTDATGSTFFPPVFRPTGTHFIAFHCISSHFILVLCDFEYELLFFVCLHIIIKNFESFLSQF